jgi:hypothetical protein
VVNTYPHLLLCLFGAQLAQHCIAGIVAGLVSRLVTFPADTLKARLQVAGALERGSSVVDRSALASPATCASTEAMPRGHLTAAAARAIWRSEGFRGFYRGFGAVAVGAAPGQAAYFCGYELGNKIIPPGYGVLGDMGVGCIAQVIAGVAFTPIDVIKERLQVQAELVVLYAPLIAVSGPPPAATESNIKSSHSELREPAATHDIFQSVMWCRSKH